MSPISIPNPKYCQPSTQQEKQIPTHGSPIHQKLTHIERKKLKARRETLQQGDEAAVQKHQQLSTEVAPLLRGICISSRASCDAEAEKLGSVILSQRQDSFYYHIHLKKKKIEKKKKIIII